MANSTKKEQKRRCRELLNNLLISESIHLSFLGTIVITKFAQTPKYLTFKQKSILDYLLQNGHRAKIKLKSDK